MNNLIKQHTPQLEQELIALYTGNEQAKKWFSQSVKNILESRLDSFTKSDVIADTFISIDAKIDYIKEQQKLLSNLKKQLESAKTYAKEEVSNNLLSFGVMKLEGLKVSSITVTKSSETTVAKLEVLNKDELLKLGYFKVVLDEEAIEQALLSADKRPEVEEYADLKIETISKRATIRINKRKSFSQDDTQIAA